MHDYVWVDSYPNGVWYDPDGKRQPGRARRCALCDTWAMFTTSDECPIKWWEPLL